MVAAVLGACSGEGGEGAPSPTATTTASATVTPSPTPTPAPSRPAAMARGDVEGAEAAARYFLSLYPYAYSTGDLEEWIALSDPECVFCASVVDDVRELHDDGGYETGGAIVFEGGTGSDPIAGNAYFGVDLVVNQDGSTRFDENGRVVSQSDGGRFVMSLALTPANGQWLVRGVSYEESTQ